MTGQDILNTFHTLIGDELDSDFELELANEAKGEIETELELEITKKLDSSNSTTSGQTSTTAKTLPTDFFTPLDIYIGTQCYRPVPFEKQQEYKDSSGFYWIDHASGEYHICGVQGSSQPIYFFYQYETPDIELDTSPVWKNRFHSLIAYHMARTYFLVDQPEKARSWLPEYENRYQSKKRLMIDWDAKLKLAAMDNSSSSYNDSYSEDHINL